MRRRWLVSVFLIAAVGAMGTDCVTGTARAPSPAPASAANLSSVDSGPAPLASASALSPPSPSAEPVPAPPQVPAPSYLEGAQHLEAVFRALSALPEGSASGHAQRLVHILQYGDSHTASDLGVSVFRRAFQARFGDGGRGYLPIGKPWKGYWQDGLHEGMSKFKAVKFKFHPAHGDTNGPFGLLGVGVEASAADARAWTAVATSFAHFEIDYWRQPRGGTFEVLVDDVKSGRVASKAKQPGPGFFALDVPETPHKIEVRAVGDGPVRVFGMTLDRAGPGVVVDALGIVGAQIFTALKWQEAHFAEQIRHRDPALVIVAYGTNEAVDEQLTDAEYERGLTELLGRVSRAAPAASCLVLGPPDLARKSEDTGEWTTFPRILDIVAIQRRVAAAVGCAFFDQLQAMGGPGTMSIWAAEAEPRALGDRIHLKASGYAQVATSLAAEVLHAYDEWEGHSGGTAAAAASAPAASTSTSTSTTTTTTAPPSSPGL